MAPVWGRETYSGHSAVSGNNAGWVAGKAQGERPGGEELEQRGNDAEDAQDVDGVEDKDCREGGARRRAGTGMGEEFQLPSGDGFNARALRRFRVMSLYSRFFLLSRGRIDLVNQRTRDQGRMGGT
jgi:hypothetical protein